MMTVTAYRKPKTIEEALDLLSSGDFVPIAGGTDLIPQMRDGRPRNLLDISSLALSYIREGDDYIEIGPACTHTELSSSDIVREKLPLLARAAGMVGSWQIRNRGTVGGNIVNASPCADSVPALLGYEAQLALVSKKGKRTIGLNEFIDGPYHTGLRAHELLYSIRCRKRPSSGFSYIKLGRRQAVNISRMTLAVTMSIDRDGLITDIAVAGGSIFPAPSRMPEIEKLLHLQKVSKDLVDRAADLAAELMIKNSGIRWSTPYKKPVLIALMQRALLEASGSNID
jgi:xanthine dehydrogenase FAD-binding subunit